MLNASMTYYASILGSGLAEARVVHDWASEASPTLGCSIEISRDWRASEASETLFSHVYGSSRYIYIFITYLPRSLYIFQ